MELIDYLKVLRTYWVTILAAVIVAVILTFGWTAIQPRVYTADANGIVAADGSGDIGTTYTMNSLATQRIPSYVELGTSRSIAEYVIDELDLTTSPSTLVRNVTITNPADTLVIRVTAQASSPEQARDLAEMWMRGLEREVNLVETSDAETSGAIFLSPRDSARLPTSPSSPNVQLSLLVGALLGFLAGIGYALVRTTLDRKIRSADGVERETGLTVAGALPVDLSLAPGKRVGSAESSTEGFAMRESLRALRTNLQFMDVDNPPRAIVVTSPLPGDGKSTLSSRLAGALADAGERVVLIDADLRRPTQSQIFNLPGGAGLTDVLAGRTALRDVMHPVGSSGNLYVVAAGTIPPNPSELLGSHKMEELLDGLRDQAIVILDVPPLIPVTDGAILAARADGAFVIATVGKTTYDILARAHTSLERVNARTLGVVLNRVPRKGAAAAQYGYQYYGSYYYNQRTDIDASGNGSTSTDSPSRRQRHGRSRKRRSRIHQRT